jgi:phosphatidylglycerol:prolipoprotein diacylglycerol transferase
MYVIGFTASYYLVKQQLKTFNLKEFNDHFENLNTVLILSLIAGGRLGYVIFYNLSYYLNHPLEILATWSGGMSFHGGVIGLIIGGAIFCYKKGIDFWKTADLYVVTIPIGLGLGRIGNFINAELYGRATDLPWGMVFPGGGEVVRHPSQLYEALLEGVLLFTILWLSRNKPWEHQPNWPHGALLALFLIGYGVLRFLVEFTREPDSQIGLVLGFITMGQLLSSIMIVGGVLIWVYRIKAMTAEKFIVAHKVR